MGRLEIISKLKPKLVVPRRHFLIPETLHVLVVHLFVGFPCISNAQSSWFGRWTLTKFAKRLRSPHQRRTLCRPSLGAHSHATSCVLTSHGILTTTIAPPKHSPTGASAIGAAAEGFLCSLPRPRQPPLPHTTHKHMFFGFGRQTLRGFRPRSETNYMNIFAVVLGVATGVYIFGEPLKEAAVDVSKEKGGGAGACVAGQQPPQPSAGK